jgi:hypothetical protein
MLVAHLRSVHHRQDCPLDPRYGRRSVPPLSWTTVTQSLQATLHQHLAQTSLRTAAVLEQLESSVPDATAPEAAARHKAFLPFFRHPTVTGLLGELTKCCVYRAMSSACPFGPTCPWLSTHDVLVGRELTAGCSLRSFLTTVALPDDQ